MQRNNRLLVSNRNINYERTKNKTKIGPILFYHRNYISASPILIMLQACPTFTVKCNNNDINEFCFIF
jgi:hypothetical protein